MSFVCCCGPLVGLAAGIPVSSGKPLKPAPATPAPPLDPRYLADLLKERAAKP